MFAPPYIIALTVVYCLVARKVFLNTGQVYEVFYKRIWRIVGWSILSSLPGIVLKEFNQLGEYWYIVPLALGGWMYYQESKIRRQQILAESESRQPEAPS